MNDTKTYPLSAIIGEEPEALWLANALEVSDQAPELINVNKRAAAELRRLHEENEALKKDAERLDWCINALLDVAATVSEMMMVGLRVVPPSTRQGGREMTDKELLELAAKAAGVNLVWYKNNGTDYPVHGTADKQPTSFGWNPLTDDGDALRLAVQLAIRIHPLKEAVEATWVFADKMRCVNVGNNEGPCNSDSLASSRRAIVHAAAEIGKEMK